MEPVDEFEQRYTLRIAPKSFRKCPGLDLKIVEIFGFLTPKGSKMTKIDDASQGSRVMTFKFDDTVVEVCENDGVV